MNEVFTVYGVSVVAMTMALTQIIKRYVPETVVPLLPLVIGVAVVGLSAWDIGVDYILSGLVIGLVSMGVFKVDHTTVGIGKAVAGIFKRK